MNSGCQSEMNQMPNSGIVSQPTSSSATRRHSLRPTPAKATTNPTSPSTAATSWALRCHPCAVIPSPQPFNNTNAMRGRV